MEERATLETKCKFPWLSSLKSPRKEGRKKEGEEGERKDTWGSFANTKQICLWVLCFTVILSLHSQ